MEYDPDKTRPAFADALKRGNATIASVSMFLAGLCLVSLVVLFVFVIALRPIGVIVPAADDIASIMLCGIFALGFAAAVPADEHISVDFFVDRLPSGVAKALRTATYLLMIAVVGYLLLGLFRFWLGAFNSGVMMLGSLPIPRYIPMGIAMIGVAMLELALAIRFLERLITGDFARSTAPAALEEEGI